MKRIEKGFLDRSRLFYSDQVYDLENIHQIWVIGAGKAGYPMTEAVVELLAKWPLRGYVIVKEGHTPAYQLGADISILEAGHPILDQRGVSATREIMGLLSDMRPDDLVICLISSGGSALLTAPALGLTLDDIQQTTKLILSDVLGDPLESIASGPTVPETSSFQDALDVLVDFDLLNQVPSGVLQRLQSGEQGQLQETAKPGDACFDRLIAKITGSNDQAARAACKAAQEAGFNSLLLSTSLQGEARGTGRYFGEVLKQIALQDLPVARPAFVVAGGETTVMVRGDGPTDAAGAVITGISRSVHSVSA